MTEPSRTATEQFLLSRAARGAVAQLAAGALRGRKVFVETAYFAAAEQAFVIGELRAHLLQAGVVGVEDCSAEVFGHCRAFRLAPGGVWLTGYCTGGQAASGTPWRQRFRRRIANCWLGRQFERFGGRIRSVEVDSALGARTVGAARRGGEAMAACEERLDVRACGDQGARARLARPSYS